MTTRLDNILVPQAVKQIAKYGKTLTFTRITDGAYDVNTAKVARTRVNETIKGIVEEWTANSRTADKSGISLVFQAKDKLVYVAAGNFANPDFGCQIMIDGEVFTIPEGGIGKFYSGDLVCLWLLIGRKL